MGLTEEGKGGGEEELKLLCRLLVIVTRHGSIRVFGRPGMHLLHLVLDCLGLTLPELSNTMHGIAQLRPGQV